MILSQIGCACVWMYSHLVVSDSLRLSRQEYWSGLPFPSPGDLPNPRNQTQISRIAGGFFLLSEPLGKPLQLNLTTDQLTLIHFKQNLNSSVFLYISVSLKQAHYILTFCQKQNILLVTINISNAYNSH